MMKDIIVSIVCTSFNQEKYIRQALDGFVCQITDFKFEIIMHDDASTDRTVDIIQEYVSLYPDLFVPVLQAENQYSKGVNIWELCFFKARGKYIAICEGDDYWIDPYKLQKQVDFLEAHPEYGLVYGKAKIYNQDKQTFQGTCGEICNDFNELVLGNKVPTLTTMFTKSLCESYFQEISLNTKDWKMGDYPLWLYFSYKSKIKFEDKITSVYRILNESTSHSDNIFKLIAFIDSTVDIQLYYLYKFNIDLVEAVKLQRIYNICRLVINMEEYDYLPIFRKEMFAVKTKPIKLRIFLLLSYFPCLFKFLLRFRS